VSRETSRPSMADDQAVIEALGQAARGVVDADGAGEPSPRAWHELVRGRASGGRRWSNRWMLVTAGAVGLVLAFGIDFVRRGLLSSPLTFTVDGGGRSRGGDIQAESVAGSDVVFSDGTEVQLAAKARLRVAPPGPHGARMRLQGGEAHFQVVHRPRAAWFVEAGPYVVEVTGTAFDVRWSEVEQVVEVQMRSGSVRVSGPLLSDRVTLGRGQRLVARVAAGDVRIDDAHAATVASVPPIAARAPAVSTVPGTAPGASTAGAPPASGSASASVAAQGTFPVSPTSPPGTEIANTGGRLRRTLEKAPRWLAMQSPGRAAAPPVAASAAQEPALVQAAPLQAAPLQAAPLQAAPPAQPPPFEPVVPAGPAASTAWPDRRWAAQVGAGEGRAVLADAEALGLDATLKRAQRPDLAALADAARYLGRGELAAQALRELRRRFPGTSQAQGAAFLLGRSADDRGDTRAALAWYRRYRAEAPTGPYASEALGREMLAIEHLQGPAQAQLLAGEYLRRFPNGTYLLRARALLDSP